MTANVPTMATGTATSGMIADRQFCRNSSTTNATSSTASTQRDENFVDRFVDEGRRVVDNRVVDARGETVP